MGRLPAGTLDIAANVRAYIRDRKPDSRYASFDYCFNYFQACRDEGRLADLRAGEAQQVACLQLGFYLASWGMYRGSTELLQRSARHLVPVIDAIAQAPQDLWNLDADAYGDGSCPTVFDTADSIRRALGGASPTLITKIMLGTFGCVPAFDQYVRMGLKKSHGVSKFGSPALRWMADFYACHRAAIDQARVATLDFATGKPTSRRYTRAKVIDMVFFIEGQPLGSNARAKPK